MDASAIILTATLGVALALRVFCFVFELQFHYQRVSNWVSPLQGYLSLRRSFHLPVALWIVCVVCNTVIAIARSPHTCTVDADSDSRVINPDIAGIGIRVSLYVLQLVTLLCLGLGQMHFESGAIKELGLAQTGCKPFL
jgi:hypothetical protein